MAVNDLRQDVDTLLEIAYLTPQRSEYHSMEKNDISNSNLEVFNSNEALTYMAILRLKDIEKEVNLAGKKLQIDWDALEGRNEKLSMRAYFRFHQYYSSDCLLNSDEEKDVLVNSACTVSKGKRYSLSNQFENETLRILQELGSVAQNEHEGKTDKFATQLTSLEDTNGNANFLKSILSSIGEPLSGKDTL